MKELELQIRKEKFEKLRHSNKLEELEFEKRNIEAHVKLIEKCILYKKTEDSSP